MRLSATPWKTSTQFPLGFTARTFHPRSRTPSAARTSNFSLRVPISENAESASLMRSGESSLRSGCKNEGPASQPMPAATTGGVNARMKRMRTERRILQKIRDPSAVSSIAKMRLAQKHTRSKRVARGKSRPKEDGFPLKRLKREEECRSRIYARRSKNQHNRIPVVSAADDLFTDQASV